MKDGQQLLLHTMLYFFVQLSMLYMTNTYNQNTDKYNTDFSSNMHHT